MKSEERVKRILASVQTINALANVILIEHADVLLDQKFGNPILKQKATRIKEYSEDIKKAYKQYVKVKDQEFADNEHCLALWRVFSYFSLMETGQLNKYMDLVESSTESIEDSIQLI